MGIDKYSDYQTNVITQADPVKLVELMFEGAVRFINRAIKAVDDKDLESTHNNILRAYAIIAELMATLDFEKGGDIAKNLEQCYDYILHILKEADIKKDKGELLKARSLIEPLLETWKTAFTGKNRQALLKGEDINPAEPEGSEQAEPKDEETAKPKTLDLMG